MIGVALSEAIPNAMYEHLASDDPSVPDPITLPRHGALLLSGAEDAVLGASNRG